MSAHLCASLMDSHFWRLKHFLGYIGLWFDYLVQWMQKLGTSVAIFCVFSEFWFSVCCAGIFEKYKVYIE